MNALTLEPDEKILYTARKHWFTFAMTALGFFLLMLAPLALLFLPAEMQEAIASAMRFTGPWMNLIFFLASVWTLLLWVALFRVWTDYYLDVWFVTNRHVIDINQRGLFNREVSVFRLDQIQDVTVEVNGLLATLIGFGTIKVQTASEDTFTMHTITHPERLKERLMEARRLSGIAPK